MSAPKDTGTNAAFGAPLEGLAALVTGGSRGIGRAISVELAARGASVAIGYRSGWSEAEETVERANAAANGSTASREGGAADAGATEVHAPEAYAPDARAFPLRLDVADRASVAEAAESLRRRWGRVDVLVNNAGILIRKPLLSTDETEWSRVIDTNLTGPYRVVQAMLPLMRDGGVIINVSSVNAWMPSLRAGAYAVSKAALTMLTRQLAVELAPRGIRVNEVNPGTVETDLNRNVLADPDYRAARVERTLLGRLGTPEDVARAVAFLADPQSGWVTGTSLAVDGGTLLT